MKKTYLLPTTMVDGGHGRTRLFPCPPRQSRRTVSTAGGLPLRVEVTTVGLNAEHGLIENYRFSGTYKYEHKQ